MESIVRHSSQPKMSQKTASEYTREKTSCTVDYRPPLSENASFACDFFNSMENVSFEKFDTFINTFCVCTENDQYHCSQLYKKYIEKEKPDEKVPAVVAEDEDDEDSCSSFMVRYLMEGNKRDEEEDDIIKH
jgi:hypothetical protein